MSKSVQNLLKFGVQLCVWKRNLTLQLIGYIIIYVIMQLFHIITIHYQEYILPIRRLYLSGSSTRPIFRTSSLKSSQELISPSSQSSAASVRSTASYKAKEFRFDELEEDDSHSGEEEDDMDIEGSWIWQLFNFLLVHFLLIFDH